MTCFLLRTSWVSVVCLMLACEGTHLDDDATTSSSSDGSTTADASASTASTASTTSTTAPTGDATADSTADSTAGSTCTLPPVDDEVVGQLFIRGGSQGYVAADTSTSLSLVWIDDGYITEVEACAAWSIEPVAGVTIDDSGVLAVGPAVAAGTIIPVTADLEDGRRLITTELEVYVPLDSPIVGTWSELLQLPCDGTEPFTPEPYIPELIFFDTGEFNVTWTPFEIYVDYWGSFTHDPTTGALSMTVTGGNYVPPDVDGEGLATVVDGELRLEDLWLGTSQEPVTPPACGHVFQ